MTYAQTMEFINSFGHAGAPVKDLSRMEALLSALGNPHRQLKFIHIAGTNGKGSTLTYCAESTIAAGIYTVNDWRIAENKEPVKGGDVVLVSANLKSLKEIGKPTPAPAPQAKPVEDNNDDNNPADDEESNNE